MAGRRTTRRDIARGAGALALACCLPAVRAHAEALRDQPLEVREVAPGVFVAQGVHEEATPGNLGAIANVGFVVGTGSVAVVDTGGCYLWGRRLREAIARTTPLPVSHVIQTHMHPDHTFGAAAFADDRPAFVGHAKLRAALADHGPYYEKALADALGDLAAGSALVPPTQPVADRAEVDLGGRVLRLRAHGTAHTDNDLSVLDAATGTLWAGDLVFLDRVPAIDGSLLGWLARVDELRGLAAARVVPGHGPVVADWPSALDPEERYLRLLRDEVRAVLRRNGTLEEAVATVGASERDRWRLFDDYNGRNVTAAYTELEWE